MTDRAGIEQATLLQIRRCTTQLRHQSAFMVSRCRLVTLRYFLEVIVIHFTVVLVYCMDGCVVGMYGACVCGRGGRVSERGACVREGGVCGRGGCVLSGGWGRPGAAAARCGAWRARARATPARRWTAPRRRTAPAVPARYNMYITTSAKERISHTFAIMRAHQSSVSWALEAIRCKNY